MINSNSVTKSDFIFGEYYLNSDNKKKVCILKSDILRIWEEKDDYCKIFLKSKQNCPADDKYIKIRNGFQEIISQL